MNIIDKYKLVLELKDSIKSGRIHKKRNIYLVGKDKIAKEIYDEDKAKNEYEMGIFLFNQGVNVPQMHCLIKPFLFNPKISYPNSRFIIMEKINGIEYWHLDKKDKEKALPLYKKEIEKVLELGIYPWDSLCSDNNKIFDYENEKIYLIDFGGWRKGSIDEINGFYEKIENLR